MGDAGCNRNSGGLPVPAVLFNLCCCLHSGHVTMMWSRRLATGCFKLLNFSFSIFCAHGPQNTCKHCGSLLNRTAGRWVWCWFGLGPLAAPYGVYCSKHIGHSSLIPSPFSELDTSRKSAPLVGIGPHGNSTDPCMHTHRQSVNEV